MNKKIYWAVIIMISTLANSATATPLTKHLVLTQEKKSLVQSLEQVAMITGSTYINNDISTYTEENPKLEAKSQKATPLARVLAQSANPLSADSFNEDKTLSLEISELRDNSGLVYLGGKVSLADLSGYLEQLKTALGEEQYAIYRQYQAARDQQTFHITLVNPYEYQTINKAQLKLPEQFRVILHGLGHVENDEKNSYFVVASSADGQFIRQNLLLKNKDFHVTLGFFPDDIYGVSKGQDTLINK
ncbi:hypothetical protein H4J58_13860 [Colwellia sp. MB3u-70]|uniref:hypothetical protein n=1 Tax=unclassified Colwellia TaxID=196834 RepID=UPI0015F5C9EE|nr:MULTISPECIES: hypothetical protein [unclassified Colwellia]MBA6291085.1 hypothetical protein [Colwellia sp. MB3u-8]MBA6308196.1 hypothetical protein [Colwellia sp. MB3u-70]